MEPSSNQTRIFATQSGEIDQLASEFETRYRRGERPRIEAFLHEYSGSEGQLLRELLAVEVRLRQQAGEPVEASEYLERFPDHQGLIGSLLLEQPTSDGHVANETHEPPVDFGDYRLIRRVGEGGMGVVYEAEQKSLNNRRVAIKTIKYVGNLDHRAGRRFRIEVDAVAQLEHRHIVPVLHVGREQGIHFYAMKFINGKDLRQLIKTLKSAITRSSGSRRPVTGDTHPATPAHADATVLSAHSGWSKGDTLASNHVIEMVTHQGSTAHPQFVRNFAKMGTQIADALHHAHQQGVVHRDIKPANLMLDVDGDAWLTDFGLAMIRDQPELTAPGSLVGTYHYMSPEQAMGSHRVIVDHRTDIYSLGVTLYELLTLQRAFPGSTREEILRKVQFEKPLPVRKVSPGVPVDLETIVSKAMAKDPNARFQSAEEMSSELRRFLDGKPLTIRPPTIWERFGYWARANRPVVASVAAVFLTIFLASIVSSFLLMQAQAETLDALAAEQEQRTEVERQKNRVSSAFRQSEGMRLASNSLLQVETDTDLALRLAIEAAELYPGVDAHEAALRALDSRHLDKTLRGHEAPAGHVAFSSDGKKVVSSPHRSRWSQDEALGTAAPAIVWDVASGEIAGRLSDDRSITSAVFSPDNALILGASSPDARVATNDVDDTLTAQAPKLWDGRNYREILTFDEAYLFEANARVFSPDSKKVVLPVNGNQAAIFFTAGTKLIDLSGHTARVVYAEFSPAGDQVVTLADDNTVRVWDAASGQQQFIFDDWPEASADVASSGPEWVQFTPDGDGLAIGSSGPGIELYELRGNGELINADRVQAGPALFFASGDLFATYGGEDYNSINKLTIRNGYDGQFVTDIVINQFMRKVIVSADGTVAGVLSYDHFNQFQIWDLNRRELVGSFGNTADPVNDFAISPDSSLIVTATHNGDLLLWNTSNGRERATYSTVAAMGRPQMVSSPDGNIVSIVAQASNPHSVLCNFDDPDQHVQLPAKIALPESSGPRMLTAREGQLAIRATEDGRALDLETFLLGKPVEVAINRDGDCVAAYTGGPGVLLWRPDTQDRRLLSVDASNVNLLRFQPDGERLFAITNDGKIRVWNAQDGALIKAINNGGQVYDIVFRPDGKQFAVTTLGSAATLYDAETLEAIRDVGGEESYNLVRFSADGSKLILYQSTKESHVAVWDLASVAEDARLEMDGRIGIAVHPSDPELLVWSNAAEAVVWNYETDEATAVTDEPISAGAYSPDGSRFYLATLPPIADVVTERSEWPEAIEAPRVGRWSRTEIAEQVSVSFSSERITKIKVAGNGNVFVEGERYHRIVNHDIQSHEEISTIAGHFATVTDCLYLSDSKDLITTSWDAQVSRWKVSDGSLISRWDQQSPVLDASLSKDDRFLVTAAVDGAIRVWNLEESTENQPVVTEIEISETPLTHVSISPSSNRMLAITTDGQPSLIDRVSGEVIEFDFQTENVTWVEFAPDESSVLVVPKLERSEASHLVYVVPLDNSDALRFEFDSLVRTSHFHPESQLILTATIDGRTTLQRVDDGEVEQVYRVQPNFIQWATFDPTGDYVYVATVDQGTIWKRSQNRMWLTVEDAVVVADLRHTQQPFVGVDPQRVITQRTDTRQFREIPLDPPAIAISLEPRELSEIEEIRYRIPVEDDAVGDESSEPVENEVPAAAR